MKHILFRKIPKGEAGYIKSEKKRRLLITLVLFGVPLFIFFTAWAFFKSRQTIWTIVALVGCLPACKALVGVIMIWMRKPIDPDLYERIRAHQGNLLMAYESYMTFYEKSAFLDAMAIRGGDVVIFSTDQKIDVTYMASHIREALEKNGYHAHVSFLLQEKKFLDRLEGLQRERDADTVKPREDSRYPGMTRDEILRTLLLDLCL